MAQLVSVQRKLWLAGVAGAIIWNLYSVLSVHPHHLAFFNELSGGLRVGHRHLLDANVEWGQATLELKNWLVRWRMSHEPEDLYLSSFADPYCVQPQVLGLVAQPLPMSLDPESQMLRPLALEKLPRGLYAISANHLHAYRHHQYGDPDCSEFLNLKPIAVIGYAIHVFELPAALSGSASP